MDDDIDPDEVPLDEPEDDEELIDEIPVHGVATVEGRPTGDGRMFAHGAIDNRELPLPILYQPVSVEGHKESVVTGRLDEVWRTDDGEIRYRGALMVGRPYTAEIVEGIIDGTVRGVSVDVDDIELDMQASEGNGFTEDGKLQRTVFSHARISAFTIVAIPAFAEAYIALGHEFEDEMTEEQLVAAAQALEDCGCDEALVAAGDEPNTSLTIMLLPKDEDPVVAASSEQAHMTFIWFGDVGGPGDVGPAEILPAVAKFAADNQPFALKVRERGELGDQGADVLFLEPTDEVLAMREAMLAEGTALRAGHDAVEQHPQWTPHVTLGYPETPALGEYSGEQIEFDRIAVWAGDIHFQFQLGVELEDQEGIVASANWGQFAPGTKDGPGWITHPIPTARIRRYWVRGKGAAKIRWGVPGDFNRCRRQLAKYVQNPEWLAGLCANMHKEAIGVWPGRERGDKHAAEVVTAAAPLFSLVASAGEALPAEWFRLPDDLADHAIGVVVDGDRVYGYIAHWGVCHIGIPGACTMAPSSKTDYALFRTGSVQTSEGPIAVGQITMGTGHADGRGALRPAASHYDHTGAAVADIAVGENTHGIWFAGALRESATDEQRRDLAASGRLSGDWRRWQPTSSLELVAALAVNVPGFPIPRVSLAAAGGEQISLVAAGIVDAPDQPCDCDDAPREHALAAARAKFNRLRLDQAREKVRSQHGLLMPVE